MNELALRHPNEKRFEDFFAEEKYVVLKNYLYNYLLRKRAVENAVMSSNPRLILEIGAGLSPMITRSDDVVYSELSHRALKTLRDQHGRGMYVVADGTRLPFRDGVFSHAVCSEVLEHVENDVGAMTELARILDTDGLGCITVPYRQFYFAADDRFVRHFRRYEPGEIQEKLARSGLRAKKIDKVLGPLEKVTMYSTVMAFSMLNRSGKSADEKRPRHHDLWLHTVAPVFKWANRFYAGLAWLDARIMPRAIATVVFIQAKKI